MKVLVACEYSGTVRRAFRERGHDAWSADLLPSDDNSPYHITGDAVPLLNQGWDLLIAHPPCTYLANSGVRWLYQSDGTVDQQRWASLIDGAQLFLAFLNAPVPRRCIENPIQHKHAKAIIGVQQTQTIQPYEFGHLEQKATCLWLVGLPKLEPTSDLKAETLSLPKSVRGKVHYASPSPDRWKFRSTTYSGIAAAMAEQWGQSNG